METLFLPLALQIKKVFLRLFSVFYFPPFFAPSPFVSFRLKEDILGQFSKFAATKSGEMSKHFAVVPARTT